MNFQTQGAFWKNTFGLLKRKYLIISCHRLFKKSAFSNAVKAHYFIYESSEKVCLDKQLFDSAHVHRLLNMNSFL